MRALCAERRWVMSGTPAKGTSVQLGLSSLYGLLSFVGHPVCADGGRQWRREYATPLERGADGGAARYRTCAAGHALVPLYTFDAKLSCNQCSEHIYCSAAAPRFSCAASHPDLRLQHACNTHGHMCMHMHM